MKNMEDDKSKLRCPHCGEEQTTFEEPNIDVTLAYYRCEHCGKLFSFSCNIQRSYSASKESEDLDAAALMIFGYFGTN